MNNYYLLKVTEQDNEILEIYEDETTAKFCGNLYYTKEGINGKTISVEVIKLETKNTIFKR